MKLNQSIPSFLRFGRFLVRVWHPNQTSTCRKCNCAGHLAKECQNVLCFNCEELGHVTRDCLEPFVCAICREAGHLANCCRFSWRVRPRDDPSTVDPAPPPHRPSSDTAELMSSDVPPDPASTPSTNVPQPPPAAPAESQLSTASASAATDAVSAPVDSSQLPDVAPASQVSDPVPVVPVPADPVPADPVPASPFPVVPVPADPVHDDVTDSALAAGWFCRFR